MTERVPRAYDDGHNDACDNIIRITAEILSMTLPALEISAASKNTARRLLLPDASVAIWCEVGGLGF